MAQLQSSGPIGVNNVRGLKGLTTGSLQTLEKNYMTSNTPALPKNSGICMPEDLITVTDAQNNTGTLKARNRAGSWDYQAAPGYTSSLPWGPHSLKEFYEAYSGVPTVALQKFTTGVLNSFTLRVTITGEFSKTASNYFININGAGWTGWPGNASGVYDSTRSSGTYTVQVKDKENCGSDGTITATIVYP